MYDYSLVEYKNYETKVKIICKIHGIFEQSPHMHLSNNKCPMCSKNMKRSLEKFINMSNYAHNFKYDYSKSFYVNDRKKVCIICPKHGEFMSVPNSHIFGKTGCPKCNSSKGENIIREILSKNLIIFEEQKKFEDCKNIRCLPFDFYIQSKNILIEFQGIQHFFQTKNRSRVEYVQKNDSIKKEWCKKNNIELIEISYLDKCNIEKILKEKCVI